MLIFHILPYSIQGLLKNSINTSFTNPALGIQSSLFLLHHISPQSGVHPPYISASLNYSSSLLPPFLPFSFPYSSLFSNQVSTQGSNNQMILLNSLTSANELFNTILYNTYLMKLYSMYSGNTSIFSSDNRGEYDNFEYSSTNLQSFLSFPPLIQFLPFAYLNNNKDYKLTPRELSSVSYFFQKKILTYFYNV
jgi:hypothetical protein